MCCTKVQSFEGTNSLPSFVGHHTAFVTKIVSCLRSLGTVNFLNINVALLLVNSIQEGELHPPNDKAVQPESATKKKIMTTSQKKREKKKEQKRRKEKEKREAAQ